MFSGSYKFQYGKADWIRKGDNAVILTYGCMLHRAVQASMILKHRGIGVSVVNVSCPFSIEREMLIAASKIGLIITYEDHNINTGLGSIIANRLIEEALSARLKKIGITSYGLSGKPDDIFKATGLDVDTLVMEVEKLISLK